MQLDDGLSEMLEREVYPINRHLRKHAKVEFKSNAIKSVVNTSMLSLIAYAKTESDLRNVEEEHMHLIRNLNLVYSGHSKLGDFLISNNNSEHKILSSNKATDKQKKSNVKPNKLKEQNRVIDRKKSAKYEYINPRNSFVDVVPKLPSISNYLHEESKLKINTNQSPVNRKKINQSVQTSFKDGINNNQNLVKGVDGKLIPLLSSYDHLTWAQPIMEKGQSIEITNSNVNKVSKLHSQMGTSTPFKDSQENVKIKQVTSSVQLPSSDDVTEKDENIKDTTKPNMDEGNKTIIQTNENNKISEIRQNNKGIVEQTDNESEDDQWTDFSSVSTPVVSKVEHHLEVCGDAIDEFPSYDEDELHTPPGSFSPSLIKSEIQEIKSNKETKVFKEACVSPVLFLLQSPDTLTSDHTENEFSGLTECSTTLNDHISEGQILLSEGELHGDDFMSLKSLENTIYSEDSQENLRYFEKSINPQETFSAGELRIFGRSSISEGEIIQADDYQYDSSSNESSQVAPVEDDMTGMLLSNVGSLLTELATTGSTSHENSFIQN